MIPDTIPARLLKQAEQRPYSVAYAVRTPDGWVKTVWADYASETRLAAQALVALGFEIGHTTCILGFNRPEWVMFDIATMMAGGAPAGIYTTCSTPEVQYIIDHAESRIVLLENKHQWEKVREERDKGNLPHVKHIVLMDDADDIDDPMTMSWETFLSKGSTIDPKVVDDRLAGLGMDQLATMIYTSGTTGPPKAVMLSHKNLSWTADVAKELTDISHHDRSLSYLPLSHIAEQMFSIHGPISHGVEIYFAESLDKLKDNLIEVQPTVIFGVPRVWEKFHAAVNTKLSQATGAKAKIVNWSMGIGRKVCALRNEGKEPSGFLNFQYKIANRLFFRKVQPLLGLAEARMCVSGAAPIAAEVLEFFTSVDIIIHEVYGQSEDCGPTSFNLPGEVRFGTVGRPVPGVEVRIAEDGEIMVKGPNVFLGYYKDQAATDETLVDGWLMTGDLGRLDDDNFLHITGRKKEIIITAGGKNIAPKNIEAALKNQHLVAEAVMIGDRRKFCSALITLDEEALGEFLSENALPAEGAHENPVVVARVQEGVDAINPLFAPVEQIKKFHVLPRNFTIEDGELTPTQKIKRSVIAERYAEDIDAMYA